MKKEYPKKAIILAAGMGVRMEALTRDTPKCMAPIKGTTIIKNALEILRHKGVRKITLVCGYLESRLTNYCSNLGTGLDIEFLSNPDYQFTNNMYSLHIALSSLDEACWVIEGDVFFQKDFFDNFSPSSTATWLGDSGYRKTGGSFLTVDSGILQKVSILRSVDEIKDSMCKSTGVFYLAREKIKTVSGWFRKAVEEKKTGLYYDLILGEHLCDMPIYVHNVYPRKWAEIDTPEELEEAERFLA